MKVTIDIPDIYVPVLRKWASVSRTLMEASKLLEGYLDNESDKRVHTHHRINDCVSELDELTTPLDVLHQTTRSAIWERDRKGEEIISVLELTRDQMVLIAQTLDLHRFITEDGEKQKRTILGLISEALED